MKTKDGNTESPDHVWSVTDLLYMAADDWDKCSGQYMDDAQKADKITSDYFRLMAESNHKKAARARELATTFSEAKKEREIMKVVKLTNNEVKIIQERLHDIIRNIEENMTTNQKLNDVFLLPIINTATKISDTLFEQTRDKIHEVEVDWKD